MTKLTERFDSIINPPPMVTVEITEEVFKRLEKIRQHMTLPLRKEYEGMEIHPDLTYVTIDDVIRELLAGRVTEKAPRRRKK